MLFSVYAIHTEIPVILWAKYCNWGTPALGEKAETW